MVMVVSGRDTAVMEMVVKGRSQSSWEQEPVVSLGILLVIFCIWEIPKIMGPNMDPKIVGLLL